MDSSTPRSPFGSMDTMLSSIEYMKKAWSSFKLPAQMAPTMDLEELDKRITDLKAVEQWLNMNLNLLKGTIQGMEIQRGTIAAVAAFGQAFDRTGKSMADLAQQARAAVVPSSAAADAPTAPATFPFRGTFADPSRYQTPAAPSAGASGPEDGGHDDPDDSNDADDEHDGPDENPADAPSAGAASGGGTTSFLSPEMAAASAQMVNPSAWWGMLQNQFNQIVQAAAPRPSEATGEPGSQPSDLPSDNPAPRRASKSATQAKGAPKSGAPRSAKTRTAKAKTNTTIKAEAGAKAAPGTARPRAGGVKTGAAPAKRARAAKAGD